MNVHNPHRGGAPVGHVADLELVEAGAVLCLRMWCDGPEAQADLWNQFATALDPASGRRALKSLETLCDLWVRHARRPVMRHQAGCKCLGADEACFARFVGAASDGDREDALMIAATVVRADIAPLTLSLAEEFGFALRRMAQPPAIPAASPAPGTLLH